MISPPPDWLWQNLCLLARFQFSGDDFQRLGAGSIRFVTWHEAAQLRGPIIGIPSDPPEAADPLGVCRVAFSGTQLTLWNMVPAPGPDWSPYPDADAPLWWRHESGSLVPAWALWPNLVGLLTGEEDRSIAKRDRHGRLPLQETPRFKAGLHRVPAVNEALAVLLDGLYAVRDGVPPRLALPAGQAKLTVLLSHDCDILGGNDWLTQGVRLYRAARAIARGDIGETWRRLRAAVQNAVFPGRYYLRNLLDMIALEHRYGYRSICYILNGNGGRFGARDHARRIRSLVKALPAGCELGLHYNYDTFEDAPKFSAQCEQFTALTGQKAVAGRAHYLRFDFLTGPGFLEKQGILLDESSGWIEELSLRNGIAGPFRPLAGPGGSGQLVEVPLVMVDSALRQDSQFEAARSLFAHLSRIGGMITGLFHPGAADNPEEPSSSGAYVQFLELASAAGAQSLVPSQILESAAPPG